MSDGYEAVIKGVGGFVAFLIAVGAISLFSVFWKWLWGNHDE